MSDAVGLSPATFVAATAPHVDNDALRYASVWEDAAVLRAGLRITPGDRVLSIAAAGDNVFALLLDDPGEVVAVDLSATQLHVCALKMLALRHLDTDTLHRFCGFADASVRERRAIWRELRPLLSAAARAWFDAHPDVIDGGLVHAGKLEQWFRFFSERVLPLVQRRSTLDGLVDAETLDRQRAIFHEHFDHRLWRLACRVFFSQALMKRGRDPAFLRFVDDESVGSTMLRRAERALTMHHVRSSLFSAWLFTGGPSTRFLPPWARAEHRAVLVERLDRVRLVQGDLRQVAAREGAVRPFDAMNLSDIFEYMSLADSQATWRTLAAASDVNARLLWWLLLVDRRPAAHDALVVDVDRAAELWRNDAGFFYGGLVVAGRRH